MASREKLNEEGWSHQVSVLQVPSSIDGTDQPTLYYGPQQQQQQQPQAESESCRRPLLVALHTWSADYTQGKGQTVFADWCIRRGWYFLHPNFRGPNTNSMACGSDRAIQDVLDAVEHTIIEAKGNVDLDRIYLVGVSGGGHMSLLVAARHPNRWAGVSAWAAISDLEAWWRERSSESQGAAYRKKYANNIEDIIAGKPDGTGPLEECRKRSPLAYLSLNPASRINLDINAGISDGREGGSVPFSHSLRAYDALLPLSKKHGESWISDFYTNQRCPCYKGREKDKLYGNRKIHYRSMHGSSRVTIFEGGHEILHVAALNWLKNQRRGQSPVWEIPSESVDWIAVDDKLTQSGK